MKIEQRNRALSELDGMDEVPKDEVTTAERPPALMGDSRLYIVDS